MVNVHPGRVICIGSANLDKKAICGPIRFGTSNPVQFQTEVGGVARNVAENLTRLGMDCTLMAFVGDDDAAETILAHCRRSGIDTSPSVRIPNQASGTYMAILNRAGELQFALADMELYDSISWSFLDSAWGHVEAAHWVFVDTNLPAPVLHTLMEKVRHGHQKLAMDAVSVEKASRIPADLSGVSLLVANRDEAQVITHTSQSHTDLSSLDAGLRALGAERFVITLGKDGVFFRDGKVSGTAMAPAAAVADVTGAGDAFVAGTLCGLEHGLTLARAVAWGTQAAQITLESHQTVSKKMCLDALEGTKETQ